MNIVKVSVKNSNFKYSLIIILLNTNSEKK